MVINLCKWLRIAEMAEEAEFRNCISEQFQNVAGVSNQHGVLILNDKNAHWRNFASNNRKAGMNIQGKRNEKLQKCEFAQFCI